MFWRVQSHGILAVLETHHAIKANSKLIYSEHLSLHFEFDEESTVLINFG